MFSSPIRLAPPLTPRRVPSPSMSPGGRRGRTLNSSDESHLRDLSPNTTLRAFTQVPMPFDTTRDEYKFFACVENLTAAERDLGTRVAKAAQRLKSWCAEIEQWGWSGSFEQPSDEFRKQRRTSLEARIREHVSDADVTATTVQPLEYLGSLLLGDVQSHEARLDDIQEEMLKLDVDELKEHVLDMFPSGRPSSAGFGAGRDYKPMDDFSFLITQTLLSALPNHARLKERLLTWTSRVSILREAPRFKDDLSTAQKAMQLGWDAIEPPRDDSDDTFDRWKDAIDTINRVLRGKVSDLGRRLDRMLDTLEGREDCLPDDWVDVFEGVEGDYGRWAHDSASRIIDFDVRRKGGPRKTRAQLESMSRNLEPNTVNPKQTTLALHDTNDLDARTTNPLPRTQTDANLPTISVHTPDVTIDRNFVNTAVDRSDASNSNFDVAQHETYSEGGLSSYDEDDEFDEGDTIVHKEVDERSEESTSILPASDDSSTTQHVVEEELQDFDTVQPRSGILLDSPVIMSTIEHDTPAAKQPHTPRSRRGSVGSLSSEPSLDSSSPSVVEESPSVRNATNRHVRAPRPELNAVMSKRRPLKTTADHDIVSAPWPPSQFSQKLSNSNEDLERKISDILTTIPAHIRLTSGPGADAPEVKSARRITHKTSKGYLRAGRSASGVKFPELTLSPAKHDTDSASANSGRKSAAARGDNDIKLYHLTQPGKEQPAKLFIRRVGENGERVMVRVGGGWADLGEYLRQYAEHHGRRTVSESRFEIHGMEVKNPGSSPVRTESAMSKRERPFNGGRAQTVSPHTTPVQSSGIGFAREDPPPPMPRMPSFSSFSTTPGVPEELPGSSPSPSQRYWQGKEVGLAGPKAKKMDLSGDKLEWIEGMMKLAKQPRSASTSSLVAASHTPLQREDRADSRNESRPGSRAGPKRAEFVDLGKVGGTKRIFLKEGPPSFS
ncbi:hypothetical protein P153DRAFT_365680, partial [Dothidotthia symphoricarpi CBS 119687]